MPSRSLAGWMICCRITNLIELFQLLAACVEYSRESEGAFDITVAPLMKARGFFKVGA
jgi:thiamine biosynthesis lipoprotein ApbE